MSLVEYAVVPLDCAAIEHHIYKLGLCAGKDNEFVGGRGREDGGERVGRGWREGGEGTWGREGGWGERGGGGEREGGERARVGREGGEVGRGG